MRRGLREVGEGASLLEIGAGQGALGARLCRRFRYVGVESDPDSAELANRRITPAGGTVLVGAAEEVVRDRCFDGIAAFEVLEHLEDDVQALIRWGGWLRPGGCLVLSVPAHPERFGPGDVAVGHYRRYTGQQLQRTLEEAGFEPLRVWSYGWPLGYALEAVRNRLARGADGHRSSMEGRTAASGRWLQPRGVLAPLTWLVTLPSRAIQLPLAASRWGTGLVAVARWPGPR